MFNEGSFIVCYCVVGIPEETGDGEDEEEDQPKVIM